MEVTIDLSEEFDPNAVGEILMDLISPPGERWGYTTHDFRQGDWVAQPVNLEKELTNLTLLHGCFAKEEWWRTQKYYNEGLNLIVYLYWDGDGCIVIHNTEEEWTLYNGDMKKSYEWEWVDEYCWVFDLPDNYYETKPF